MTEVESCSRVLGGAEHSDVRTGWEVSFGVIGLMVNMSLLGCYFKGRKTATCGRTKEWEAVSQKLQIARV